MKFSPVTIILIILAIVFIGGGRAYNNGAYANAGYGIGSVLFVLFILFLVGVI